MAQVKRDESPALSAPTGVKGPTSVEVTGPNRTIYISARLATTRTGDRRRGDMREAEQVFKNLEGRSLPPAQDSPTS